MTKSTIPRVTMIALSAIALFFLANYMVRYLVGLAGLGVTIVVALGIALFIGFSVARMLKRPPTAAERSRLLWLYGGALGALFAAFAGFVFLTAEFSKVELAIVLLHYVPYPLLAAIFLSELLVTRFLGKAG